LESTANLIHTSLFHAANLASMAVGLFLSHWPNSLELVAK